MKTKLILFTVFALLLGGVGCEEEKNKEFILTGLLEYSPTMTTGECGPRTHILKTDENEFQLLIQKNEIDTTPFENSVVTVFGEKIEEMNSYCPILIKVKKIIIK